MKLQKAIDWLERTDLRSYRQGFVINSMERVEQLLTRSSEYVSQAADGLSTASRLLTRRRRAYTLATIDAMDLDEGVGPGAGIIDAEDSHGVS